MKYNQPYGISDPNGPYINGNPSTGTMGSIPPAASIEHPQREIVQVITSSGLTPTDTDLQQLARGIQNGAMNYGVAGGTPNALSVNLSPVPLSYTAGLTVILKTISTPTDLVQINCNSLGGKSIVSVDGQPVREGAWGTNYIIVLVYDGTRFVLVSASALVIGGVTKLTAHRDYFVNVATGSDTNPGTTAGLPFKTIQKGVTTVGALDLNGYSATVNVADGFYGELVRLPGVSINGIASLIGNDVTPANCTIVAPAGSAIATGVGNMTWHVHGFKIGSQAGQTADWGHAIWVTTAGQTVWYWNIDFSAVEGPSAAHVYTSNGGTAIAKGTDYGGGSVKITGKAPLAHAASFGGNNTSHGLVDLVIVGAQPIGQFCYGTTLGIVQPHYNTITGNSVGARYLAVGNSIIDSRGGGASYFPGTTAGSVATGGQYL